MARLARPVSMLQSRYDAVVVGSGYGGGVAACRLARLGLSVAVLERGREVLPGEFPRSDADLGADVLWCTGGRRRGREDGLYTLAAAPAGMVVAAAGAAGAAAAGGGGITVLGGAGLGGGSLIGAGVALNPDMLVLEDDRWPVALRTDHYLSLGFERARGMLAPRPLPETMQSARLQGLEAAASGLARTVDPLPLHIQFDSGKRGAATPAPPCTGCGDCLAGCNVGAMTTVASSYLAAAAQAGAALFTAAAVRYVEPAGAAGWRVVLRSLAERDEPMPLRAVTAGIVVLAAGTLGTVEILMRSRERGLPLSDELGRHVSTGALALAAGTVNGGRAGTLGIGHPAPSGASSPGPAVTGAIDLRRRRDPGERMLVTDLGLPEALGAALARWLAAHGGDAPPEGERGAGAAGGGRGALDRLRLVAAVAPEVATAAIVRAGDGVALVADAEAATAADRQSRAGEALAEVLAAGGARPVAAPVAAALAALRLSLGPLGGAVMGETRASGVVDHRCRVFDSDPRTRPDAVHPGLFVVDGAVMPRPLGVPPLLTIAAIAERAMLLLARGGVGARGLAAGITAASTGTASSRTAGSGTASSGTVSSGTGGARHPVEREPV